MATAYLDPDSDVVTTFSSTGANHFDQVNQGDREPDSPASGGATNCHADANGEVLTLGYENLAVGSYTVSKIVVWIYFEDDGTFDSDVDINMGGWVGAQEVTLESEQWYSVTFNGSWTKADLDGLQVTMDCGNLQGFIGYVWNQYVEVTYTEGAASFPWSHVIIT